MFPPRGAVFRLLYRQKSTSDIHDSKYAEKTVVICLYLLRLYLFYTSEKFDISVQPIEASPKEDEKITTVIKGSGGKIEIFKILVCRQFSTCF
jgi:hypothetical protein